MQKYIKSWTWQTFFQKNVVFSIILSIFAEIFDESLESEGGMSANIERDKLKTRKDKLAGYFFDISKLSFGAMVLGGLTPMITGEFDYMNLLYVLFGVCMTILFAIVGNRILKY